MHEVKKRRIVLASVLKPANEPRMFDKIGTSLAKNFEVYCIGGPVIEGSAETLNPTVITLNGSGRISLFRLVAPFLVLGKILKLKPSLLIICTHELLFISVLAKLVTRCKIIYDVQENYYLNISFGNSFPAILSIFLAPYVRIKERISKLFIDHYFLAEKGYEKEMNFFGLKKTVLENKLVDSETGTISKRNVTEGNIRLLFSGTLAETTGVFIAIELAAKLYELDRNIRLRIIGSSASVKTLELIKEKVKDLTFVELTAESAFVPHERILDAIRSSQFGIICYPPNPSTFNAMPTKLFEYLGLQLPILLLAHPVWSKQCEPFNAAISFNPVSLAPDQILHAMKTREFYRSPPENVFWSSEEAKLMQTIESLGF
jgi:hypothetical protein